MNRQSKSNWLDPTTTAETEVLPKYLKWAWSSRAVSLGLNVILIMQLTYYCTDILGLKPALVGGLLLASKVFDGFTDLTVGYIIDRTKTPFGKARPYEVFIIFVWIFTVMLFSVPELNTVGMSVYVFVLYTLINSVCSTFLNGADAVYLSRSIRSEKNRVSVLSFNGGVIMICSIIVSILLPQLVNGIGATKGGWTVIALIFAIPLAAIGMLRFVFVKEVEAHENKDSNEEKQSLKETLHCVSQNKYIFILAGMTFLAQIVSTMGTSANTYYFKYIIGDIGLSSLVALSNVATPLVLLIFPWMSRKFGTVNILKYGLLLGILGYGIRIAGGTNLVMIVIGSLFAGISILPITIMISIYLIDCMDYGEWKTGVRVEGMLGSINAFCNKLGSGVASGAVGVIMGIAGFDGALAVQSSTAISSIKVIFNWLPLLLLVVTFFLSLRYNLDKELPQIKKELGEARRG